MAKKKNTNKTASQRIKQYMDKLETFEQKKSQAIYDAMQKKGTSLTREEMQKAVKNIKSGLTREERAELNEAIKDVFKTYKEAHKEGKKKYKQRYAERVKFSDFKEFFREEFAASGSLKDVKKEFADVESYRELSDYSYRVKYDNFKRNVEHIKEKAKRGEPLTEAEQLMLDYQFPKRKGRRPIGDIIELVNYFDKLGLSHIAFDS